MWLEFVEERSSFDTVPLSAEQLQQAVRFLIQACCVIIRILQVLSSDGMQVVIYSAMSLGQASCITEQFVGIMWVFDDVYSSRWIRVIV